MPGTRRRLLLQVQQPRDLRFALGGGVIFEMRIDDPQRAETQLGP